MTMLYAVAGEQQNSERKGEPEPLPVAQRRDLHVDGQKAVGPLKLALADANQRSLNFQITFVNGAGKRIYTQVNAKVFRAPEPSATHSLKNPLTTIWILAVVGSLDVAADKVEARLFYEANLEAMNA